MINTILKPKSVIYFILFIIITVLSVLLFLFYFDKQSDFEYFTFKNQQHITRQYESNLKLIEEKFFIARIQPIISINLKKKIEAIKSKNIEEINLLFGFHYNNIKNSNYSVFSILSSNGEVLVDFISKDSVNNTTKTINENKINTPFFEFAPEGLAYKFLTPIYDHQQIIGYIELGVSPVLLSNNLKDIFESKAYFFIKDNFAIVSDNIRVSSQGYKLCFLCMEQNDEFIKKIAPIINLDTLANHNFIVEFNNISYNIYTNDIYNINDVLIGKLVVFDDISYFELKLQELIFKNFLLILLTIVIVYLILNKYLKKVFDIIRYQSNIIDDRTILFDSIADGVFGVDKNGNCTFINQASLTMLGFKKDEILNKNQHKVFHHTKPNGEDYPYLECPVYLTLNDRQTRVSEDYFVRKENIYFPVSMTISATSDGGVVVVFRDISSIKDYERTLERKIQEAVELTRKQDILILQQARLASLGEMIGNIAHQWKQPLSVITTSVTALKIKLNFDAVSECDIQETIEEVMISANFMSHTVDNFRNFFKNNQNKEEFFVSQAIDETVNIIKGVYRDLNIELKFDIDKQILYIGSKNLLSQVILNILSNAKDALKTNHVENRVVMISLANVDKKYICFKIKDNAGGIPENITNKIFEPYFTTKDELNGTGIGLYMSVNIIQKHFQGFLLFQNEIDEDGLGACFVIKIPIVDKDKE
jgi:PAS domain S-box-containing protein